MNLGAPEFLIYFFVPIALYFLLSKGSQNIEVLRQSFFGPEARALFFGKTRQTGIFFTLLSFVFFGVALIRPQFGYQEILEERLGQDIVFVVDVSQSMLAKDLSPNRLGRVRFAITDLLSQLKGDRVGLISFAGVSFIESPLTYDYSTFRLFLDDLSPDLIPVPGTNIESALKKVIQLYGGKEKKFISGRSKTVILFSDGEELSGDLDAVLGELKELGIRVYTIGLGSEVGAPIPTERDGYKRDKGGKVILSKLDRKNLEKLAISTGGAYLGGGLSGHELEQFFKDKISIGKEKSKIAGGVVRVWQEYYQVALLLGLISYLLSVFGKRSWLAAALVTAIIFPINSQADVLDEASVSYAEGNFRQAFELYESAKTGNPPFIAELGSAKSLYKLKRFYEAKERYSELIKKEKRAEFLYNLGNTQTQLEQYEDAIKSYEEALTIVPNDSETKQNLEYVKKLLKQESDSSSSSSNNSSSSSTASNQQQGGGGQSSSQSQQGNSNSDNSSHSGEQRSSSSSSSSANGETSNSADSKTSGESESSTSSAESNQGRDSSEASANLDQSSNPGEEHKLPSEREEMLYDSVQEDRGALRKYREEKAIEELEERQESPPEKDW